ncbi:myosin-4 protein [Perilla frutescens var. hirtella]|uniref:Myosin-4 protein n=1 Tax=Perilla frutescens var. hirtella TaxID=608512 RepID=A0AAD4PBG3_PERFH|nr:myosin-4 protein [Perilla frutescens var. hirtella]KAH6813120.1 myosin-4 protein [Perilla frutescens var. frutescens]KAH6833291.1 myosin-4 protein [Perilla frutescens var. hirtella]
MQHTGAKDTQLRESSNQKVHPQPMEEATNQNPEAMEALVSRIFTNISSLKSAYIQLQAAHTPYDPDKIQAADKLVISELKNLSELKHFYRENNPKPVCASPQDSRLAAEIQEQQSLLKTYEVMVKKFQSEIQNKDSEVLQLEQQIQEANQKRVKLEKNLKLRGLSTKESEGSGSEMGHFSPDLSPDLFRSAVEAASRAIHDFSKPLINMMKAAGWDLDAAANSIEPNVVYAKRAHKKYAFESHICQRMFIGFQDESFGVQPENQPGTKESLYQQYLALREMDPLDAVGQSPDSIFGKFCQRKYLDVVHQKMEASFFGNSDQRNYIMGGGHPRTAFYQAFLKLAKAIWLLHRLVHSFDPSVKIFQVKRDSEYSEVYMESVVKDFVVEDGDEKPKVGVMVMPGFWIGGSIIQSQVYLTGVKVTE